MPDLNKVFLMGNLTFDPELRRTPSGTAVTELRMAINRAWTGRDGERREDAVFIDVTVWDRSAENCCQYLRKGSLVHVEGSLRMDTWDDKTTGEKRSKIKVNADRVQFLDTRRGEGRSEGTGDYDAAPAPPSSRDPGARRSAGTGTTDARGPSNDSGPGRAPTPGRDRPAAEPDEREEEDIPF